MRRQFKGWLKERKKLSILISLIFVLGVGLFLGFSFLWAENEVSKAKQAGESIGRSIQGALGSSSAINQKLFQPLLTPTSMYPLGGNESQGFKAQILCPSAKEFLKVVISPSATGDLTLYIYYDKGFTGSLNTSLIVSGVSAICSNGFMKCNPGTMADCSSYVFYLDGNELKYRMVVVSTGYGLSGCFCVNNACGGSNVLITNLDYVLRAVGGMIVSAFLNSPSRSSFAVSDSKIDGMSITFYGQDSSQCQFTDQGSSNVQNLKIYYQSPGSLSSTGNVLLGSQMGNPQSMASMVYSAAQLSTGDVKTCIIKRVASGCSVVERTEGDCNVSSSCRVIEETWDGISIIQGGARTKLNPVGSCVKDECGNLHCYDWTTKRVVYVCSGQNVFDPSPRIEAVTRSTTWDRDSGMVYYSDLVIPNDCTADCPSGYVYSYTSKKCEANPVCPSGSSYDATIKLCKANAICPSGYTYNNFTGICQSTPTCDPGFSYDSINKVCTQQIQCLNEGEVQNINGQWKCTVKPTYYCSNGQLWYQNGQPICVVNANCPNGGTIQNVNGQWECVVGVTYYCLNGQLEYQNGQPICVVGVSCPIGGSVQYVNEQWKCTVEVTENLVCPLGFTLDQTRGVCVAQPSDWKLRCPNGWKFYKQIYDRSRYGCPVSLTINGETWTGFEQHRFNRACTSSCYSRAGVYYYTSADDINQCTYNTCQPYFCFNNCFSITMNCTYQNVCISPYPGGDGLYFVAPKKGDPICSQGTYNSQTSMCEINPSISISCPSGYTYDSSSHLCVTDISCPSGYTYDSSLQACKVSANISCPSGYTYDSNANLCVANADISCPSGYTYDPILQACKVSANISCPSGYTYDSNANLCVANANVSCPSGSTYSPSLQACVISPSCIPGSSFNQNTSLCEAQPICPAGFSQTSNSTQETTQESCNNCPSGYSYDSSNKICIADLSCPSGGSLVYDSGRLRCVADLQGASNCPSGSSYDAGLNVCYTSVSCPSSSFDSNIGQCVASLNCPSGSSYDAASKLCEAEEICPANTAYNDETGKCEGDPVCQQGSVWDVNIARCASCPSGYSYDNASQACKSNNGTTKTVPTFSLPCSEGATYNPNTSLCEGSPSCPAGLSFDRNLNTCVATPTCPSGFFFDSNLGTCVAAPQCPTGFTFDVSRGLCVAQSSASCPSGYVYDSSLGKCVFAISCPGGGSWDTTLNKCVKQSFCVSSSSSSSSSGYCVATPSCSNGGVWDENVGKCVVETTCSNQTNWVLQPGKSFYLGKWAESSDCEFVCKIKVVEPKTGIYMKSASTTFDLQYGTKTEKTGVSAAGSYYYKPCVEEATNTWSCPIEGGEQMVDDCKCINNFGQAATIMQAIRQAGQDFICSSGRLF